MGVLKRKYAYEALSLDHFKKKGVEYLAIADRHSGMLSEHATVHWGAKELLKIPRCVYTDGLSIFCAKEVKKKFQKI